MRATLCLVAVVTALAARAATLPPVIRSGQTAYLRVEAGSLQLKVYKRDLNIYDGTDTLQACLYDPQRRVIATLDIPDDAQPTGQRGAGLQSAEVTVPNVAAGVYRLDVTCDDAMWGLQTSAPGCVLQGDILLNDGDIAGYVQFAPPATKFTIKAQAFHGSGQQQLPLLDSAGKTLNIFDLSKQGVDQTFAVAAGARAGLWQFNIAHMDVKIIPDSPVWWTVDRSAWFDAEKTKWLLLPYRQARYLKPGESATVALDLRNGTGAERAFTAAVVTPAGVQAKMAETTIGPLKPGEKRSALVNLTASSQTKAGAVLPITVTIAAADDPTIGTSAGIEVRTGQAPLDRKLDLPVALRCYEHEDWQFGYAPEYEPNEVYFDLQNHPYMRQRTDARDGTTGIQLLERGEWTIRKFEPLLRQTYPNYVTSWDGGGFLGAKIAFDGQGGAYTALRLGLAKADSRSVLIYTPDAGHSYQVVPLPGNEFDLEQFTGHNALDIPPPVLCYRFVRPHPAPYAGYFDLLLVLPKIVDGKLTLGEPVKIAENCVGSCQHSGGPASTVTRNGKTHVVWGEIAPDDAEGVPEYAATVDHATGKATAKVLLGYAPPVNDVHNVPAITQDSQGYLHIILGGHNRTFQYLRSLKPDDASAFTAPAPVLTAGYVDENHPAPGMGRQTYCSLVCGPDDTLHIAYRQLRLNADGLFPDQNYMALAVQSKSKTGLWGPAQVIVAPPSPGYSIYYHKLTIDRRGRLFLSHAYWTDNAYQKDFPEQNSHRALLMSADGGRTWKLVTTRDLLAGMK